MFDTENGSTNSQLTSDIADMLKQVRLNGPAANLNAPTNVPSTSNSLNLSSSAPEANLMSVALRRENPVGKDNEVGTGAKNSGSGTAALPQAGTRGAVPMAVSPIAQSPGPITAEGAPVRTPITVLREQQAQYSKPGDPNDPKYRMGTGQRILGTLANFASGFAGHGGSPVYVGPGALNHRYYQDEALRRENLENVTRQLAEQHRVDPDQTGAKPNLGDTSQNEGTAQPANKDSFQSAPDQTSPLPTDTIFPRTRARAIFASLRNARTQPSYFFTAKHGETNQRIGSHDGQNWEFMHDDDQTTSP